MWGTDLPHTEYEDVAPNVRGERANLARWIPNETERQSVLLSTPAKLFKFESTKTALRSGTLG